MTSPEPTSRQRTREAWQYGLAAAVFLLIVLALARWKLDGDAPFWDGMVYVKTIRAWRAGRDPYSETVYPPIFFIAGGWLAGLFGRAGWYLYLTLHFALTLTVPWVLSKVYTGARWFAPALAMLIFSVEPKFYVEYVVLGANIGTLLHAALLIAGISGVRRNRWLPFYAMVAVAALVKPGYLTYLALPLLVGTEQLWRSLLCAVTVGAGYGLERLLVPQLYRDFERMVTHQVLGIEDSGMGPFKYLLQLEHRVHPLHGRGALVAHAVLFGLLGVALFAYRRRRSEPLVAQSWIAGAVVFAITASPRLMVYDADIAIVPAAYLWVEFFRHVAAGRLGKGFGPMAIALPVALYMVLIPSHVIEAIDVLLLGSLAMLMVQLWVAGRGRSVNGIVRAD